MGVPWQLLVDAVNGKGIDDIRPKAIHPLGRELSIMQLDQRCIDSMTVRLTRGLQKTCDAAAFVARLSCPLAYALLAHLACVGAGYTGNLCAVCATHYAKTNTHTCRQCQHFGAVLALYIAAALVALAVIKMLLNFLTRDCQAAALAILGQGTSGASDQRAAAGMPCGPNGSNAISKPSCSSRPGSSGSMTSGASSAASTNRARGLIKGVSSTDAVKPFIMYAQVG